ncbi:hypothetical protein N7466_010172 [Penicillium verhagenii]|uniref:uncharacterized protein n=1 Tax=Penicillium verhagenii TaxID=1562060 RepID=UPI002544F3D6|nr:uncharacterized protein N7466_010172 [Penicillium verhagenii]KAJ5919229.1 hypothetical protein N7466_010172 [Penicillium verhagenii]
MGEWAGLLALVVPVTEMVIPRQVLRPEPNYRIPCIYFDRPKVQWSLKDKSFFGPGRAAEPHLIQHKAGSQNELDDRSRDPLRR